MIALGTHRPMTDDEIRQKVGDEVLSRVRVTQHDHRTAPLRDLGVTPAGTPIEVNEHLFAADIVIGTGAVVPHHIAGFSAGAKIVQPGVSGAATTAATHMFSARARTPLLGRVETPVRAEMDLIAERWRHDARAERDTQRRRTDRHRAVWRNPFDISAGLSTTRGASTASARPPAWTRWWPGRTRATSSSGRPTRACTRPC